MQALTYNTKLSVESHAAKLNFPNPKDAGSHTRKMIHLDQGWLVPALRNWNTSQGRYEWMEYESLLRLLGDLSMFQRCVMRQKTVTGEDLPENWSVAKWVPIEVQDHGALYKNSHVRAKRYLARFNWEQPGDTEEACLIANNRDEDSFY